MDNLDLKTMGNKFVCNCHDINHRPTNDMNNQCLFLLNVFSITVSREEMDFVCSHGSL